jgi:methylase of polypeptide subunit release factors
MEYKLPKQFDWIVINPPWLVSSKFEGESVLTDGVYDNSDMLKNALKLSSNSSFLFRTDSGP